MLKSLLTRELAMQMSFTGLNSKRQKTKIAFKTHGAYTMILRALSLTSHCHSGQFVVDHTIMNILRNAGDWNGHRGKRHVDTDYPTPVCSGSFLAEAGDLLQKSMNLLNE
ncbi:uncharacterized protein LOC125178663 [Hyalella azteca]|uniref:Uncharacterized protein LOC125178663 n=1 Tax=Hyalella azteca TaxID=294128 RepID=A0A979FP99_HYAAZ|nr:uncharacterized protein LOC125178663 [Hyalella azteca]